MARHSASGPPTPPHPGRDRSTTASPAPARTAPPRAAPRPSAPATPPSGRGGPHPSGAGEPRPSAVRRVLGGALTLVVLALVVLALAMTVVPALAGGRALTVLSPSMTPTLGIGSLVVVRPRPAEQIAVGDVMSFTDREPSTGATRTVTHRVIAVEDGPSFRTKGDANADPDQRAVTAANVIGVEWYSIPKVGGWFTSLTSGPGLVIAGGVLLLLVAGWLLAPRRSRR